MTKQGLVEDCANGDTVIAKTGSRALMAREGQALAGAYGKSLKLSDSSLKCCGGTAKQEGEITITS